MLVNSWINKIINRFLFRILKLKSMALFYLCLFLCPNLFSEPPQLSYRDDIVFSDELDNVLSEEGQCKAEALTDYMLGLIEFQNSHVFSERVLRRFINAVKNNPDASSPLRTLQQYWMSNKQPEKLVEYLQPIAEEHPSAALLNVIVADTLIFLKQEDKAIALLKKSLDAVEQEEGKDAAHRKTVLINALAQFYGKKREWSKGEELFDEASDDPSLKNSFPFLLAAVQFYALCADQGPDGFFAGWNKRRYRKKLENYLTGIEKLCETEDIPSSSLFPLLAIYKRYSMGKRAEQILLTQLLNNDQDSQAFIMLAGVYDSNGKYADAERVWKIIVYTERFPNIKRVWNILASQTGKISNLNYQLGYAALKNEDWQEAVKAFKQSLKQNPGNPAGLFQLGIAYMNMGEFRKTISVMQKISALPDAYYLTAHCYSVLNEYDNAYNAMKKAEKSAGEDREFLNKDFYMEFAYIADKSGRHKDAERLLLKQIKENPDDPMLNNFLGYLWADDNKNLDRAEQMIQKALDQDKNNSAYLDSMAWVLYRKKDYKNALNYINQAIENDDSLLLDSVISDHAGNIHAALGNSKEAVKYWKMAAETYSEDINPDDIRKKIAELSSK